MVQGNIICFILEKKGGWSNENGYLLPLTFYLLPSTLSRHNVTSLHFFHPSVAHIKNSCIFAPDFTAHSSSGPGRQILSLNIKGSTPLCATKALFAKGFFCCFFFY